MINPKELMLLQQKANRSAAQRSGKTGAKLLDDADNNIGNGTILQPQLLPPGLHQLTVIPQGTPPRLLNLTAESRQGMSTSITLAASHITSQIGAVGPVTGIIEFGNGSQSTKFEVDVPTGPYIGGFRNTSDSSSPLDSGTVVQVPTGVLRVYFRYDNAYITPTLEGYAMGGPASPLPFVTGIYGPNVGNAAPVQVKAFASYFGRHFSRAYKTQYIFVSGVGSPQIIPPEYYTVPAFAKSLHVVSAISANMTVVLLDGLSGTTGAALFKEIYTASPGTVIPIDGNTNIIQIGSATGADTTTGLKLVWEIGF